MSGHFRPYYAKAAQSWAGAESELEAGRYQTAITLGYYACFHLGVAVHLADNLPPGRGGKYAHGQIWRTIDRWVIQLGRADLVGVVQQVYGERVTAQYQSLRRSRTDAQVTLGRAEELIKCLRGYLDQLIGAREEWV